MRKLILLIEGRGSSCRDHNIVSCVELCLRISIISLELPIRLVDLRLVFGVVQYYY